MNRFPAMPGAYALLIKLETPRNLRIGQLGTALFPAGVYVYLGSALGPGGLRARIGRHFYRGRTAAPSTKPHWHIDYLLEHARPVACLYKHTPADPLQRLECVWSQALAGGLEAEIPLPGFGSSDCRAGCAAHLVLIQPSHSNLTAIKYQLEEAGRIKKEGDGRRERPNEVKWCEFVETYLENGL